MRILMLLILGIFTGGAFYYGLRLLWHTFFPSTQEVIDNNQPDLLPTWLSGRLGQLLVLLALLGILGLVLHDILSTQEPLNEHQPPPPVSSAPALIKPAPIKPNRTY